MPFDQPTDKRRCRTCELSVDHRLVTCSPTFHRLALSSASCVSRLRRVGAPEVRFVQFLSVSECRVEIRTIFRALHTKVREMVEKVSKQNVEILLILLGIKNMLVPERVDQPIWHNLLVRVGSLKR